MSLLIGGSPVRCLELAVNNDLDAVVFAGNRLLAGFKIDNA
jgi:hypothetical protein